MCRHPSSETNQSEKRWLAGREVEPLSFPISMQSLLSDGRTPGSEKILTFDPAWQHDSSRSNAVAYCERKVCALSAENSVQAALELYRFHFRSRRVQELRGWQ